MLFQNTKATITLTGILTLPSKEGNYPALILITGRGAQNKAGSPANFINFPVLSRFTAEIL